MSFCLKLHTNWVPIFQIRVLNLSSISLGWLSPPILFKLCWDNVSIIKLSACLHKHFSTCVLNSLQIFFPPLVFSSTVAVEFCFCDNVLLFRQVITNHVNCSELPARWLSGDRNCELCQSASHLKDGFEWTFRIIKHFRESNFNTNYDRAFMVITYFLFRVVWIFWKF
jgi:hypothetical protein